MKTDSRNAVMLLALDSLRFVDQISQDWDAEKQIRHLREQVALARKHLESEPIDDQPSCHAEVIKQLKELLFIDGRLRTCITQSDFDYCVKRILQQNREDTENGG